MSNSVDPSKKACDDLISYCNYFTLPLEHIAEAMSSLKVIPMIRGICFEYSVEDRLREVLPLKDWKVEKPVINAQAAIQDIDVLVTHIPTNRKISIECKLTKNDSFQFKNGHSQVNVKCMRSRTTQSKKASEKLAERYNVPAIEILRHSDSYRREDFDFVITTLGNAFWKSNDDSGMYEFVLTGTNIAFLREFFNDENLDANTLKKKTFDYMLIAESSNLAAIPNSPTSCTRKLCIKEGNHTSCGFIPNYPVIQLGDFRIWRPIERAEEVFSRFLN